MSGGSVWRKWDLHVHTPSSVPQQYGHEEDIWDTFVRELETKAAQYRVEGIGVTDYFSLEGYKNLLMYRKKGALQDLLLLPNIEFRLDRFVDGKRLNYHVIFSNEVPVEKVERDFLERLSITSPTGETVSLRRENIEGIGKTLRNQQSTFRRMTDFQTGITNITVSQDEIKKLLEDQRSVFAGKYLLVLAQEGWDTIDWSGQDHLTRKVLFVKSHALFSSNANTVKWALGELDIAPNKFVEEFGSLKPCIWGSDAKDFDRLLKPDQDRFTWVKANLTFEGLRQIMYEPAERIRIQPNNPESRKSIYTINSFEISDSVVNEDLKIEEGSLELNANLVAVIGGKGAGKTALLDILANCFEDRCRRGDKDREEKNSFVQRIEEDKPDLKAKISFFGEDVSDFEKALTHEEFFQEGAVVYLPQGRIEELSSDRNRLQKKIEEIIFSNEKVKEEEYQRRFAEMTDQISQISRGLTEMNRRLFDLAAATRQELVDALLSEKQKWEGKLKDKKDEIEISQRSLAEERRSKVEGLKGQETELRETHSRVVELLQNIGKVHNSLNNTERDVNVQIIKINLKLNLLFAGKVRDELSIPKVSFGAQFTQIARVVKQLNSQKTQTEREIEKKQKEILGFASEEKKHATLIREETEMAKKIKELEEKLKEIEGLKKDLRELEEQRKKQYFDLVSGLFALKAFYKQIIDCFSEGKTEILADIAFSSRVYFDKEKFIKDGEDVLDMRRIQEDTLGQLAEQMEAVFEKEEFSEEIVTSFIERESDLVKYLKPVRGDLLLFYEWFWGNYFSLSTDIFFNRIPLRRLSIGQRGTVLLKLLLAEGDATLIVDQPEENLDNRFVYETLVQAFREAKKKRQIMIATHNANLVVNTDAEQVIVAEYKDGRITYSSGEIEDPETRQEITSILEGGEEAFLKREQKYGMAH